MVKNGNFSFTGSHESENTTHGVDTVLFTFLVNSEINNGYCISDAFCEVRGSILYLEMVFMESRLFFAVLVMYILKSHIDFRINIANFGIAKRIEVR